MYNIYVYTVYIYTSTYTCYYKTCSRCSFVHVHTTVMMVVSSTCTCSRCSFVHVHTTVMMEVPSTCTCTNEHLLHVHVDGTTLITVVCLERILIHKDLIINNSGIIGNTGNSPE